jgi:hypothetical protein
LHRAPDDVPAVRPTGKRLVPDTADRNDRTDRGKFLLFAIACRWINDLEYVYGEGGGEDELPYAMQGFDRSADHVQLAAMTESAFRNWNFGLSGRQPSVSHLEPSVGYRSGRWEQLRSEQPYDLVCLTRSPLYTPAAADPLYAAIASTFVETIQL